ncbi:PilZ domain-containing protein [Arhodomonas sp. AD133]|uniref:PilZ domain-containing protein n=1 Tax=Arhodomonas sp. AD133 TaxID=3415009 RepID=UPI003EBF109F
MRDARRRPRDVVDQFFPVYHEETGELLGYLTDINVDGGMLEAREPLEESAIYPMRIKLQEPVEGNDELTLQARCVWNRKDRNAVFHRVGFEFVDLSPATRTLLQEFAARYRLGPVR